ncbi:tRNA pseudouridine(38-40) synthase TruA [Pseudothauera nasutitermitis]|uniref:tRNA pseudouridine synthase A n=1 Tax=Pseudothauera nasutitermitis TaxID=2565930 RepID=A0A4S4B2J9_9RHOO|nr:tRNA pseudouridine(38-40) synthase TruA [Pseudothauera nasutitermitis]THF66858.1 tRNA pseudouridine(38-40) synthase TruA [Pseudothauera nasutitermitis]
MRIALGVEYAGDAFLGWQSQPHGRGVQDALEQALAGICAHPVRVHCAGRTDAGVHASAQVVHFDTASVRPPGAWVRGVNALLPAAVAVRWAVEIDEDFHARYRAVARRYRYLLHNTPVRPALLAGRVGWFHSPLDVERMAAAAALLRGRHDFSAFRAAGCQARTPVRDLYQAEVTRHGEYVVFDFHADGFLHHMIRNLVGALCYVGKGKHPPAWIGELLMQRDRTRAAPTFMPDGLYLCGVDYPARWSLPDEGRIIALPRIPLI